MALKKSFETYHNKIWRCHWTTRMYDYIPISIILIICLLAKKSSTKYYLLDCCKNHKFWSNLFRNTWNWSLLLLLFGRIRWLIWEHSVHTVFRKNVSQAQFFNWFLTFVAVTDVCLWCELRHNHLETETQNVS